MADHDIRGVAFCLAIVGGPHPSPDRCTNAAELTREAAWADVRALEGATIPDVGLVVAVGVPRQDPVPVGARINLVTAHA